MKHLPRLLPIFAAVIFLILMMSPPVFAHDTAEADGTRHDNIHLHGGGEDGHVPPNVNYGFALVGQDALGGVATGLYTDVWAHKGYAYVGTFQEPSCTRAGVYISDVHDPANPTTVGMIKSPPDTRINDVKVHEIGGKDVLSFTLEPCGPIVGQGKATGNDTGSQRGKGGISLYDVTNPLKPHALKQNFLDTPIHNTFYWTNATGTYLMAVDDVNVNDVIIADVSKPESPKVIAVTGIGDWIGTTTVADDNQLFTGSFAAPLLHDIWVEQMPDGSWQAVLSYWDAGFIILDVSDPANPVFVADSTYPDPDPVHGTSPAEGNAHAAVFGGTTAGASDLIFGGDEDFDSLETLIFASVGGPYAATQGSDVPKIGTGADIPSLSGPTTYVGLACSSGVPTATDPLAIAIIQRGTCSFTEKATTVEAAGYVGAIVFNNATGCGASVSMLVQAGIPALFVPRSSGFALLKIAGYDPTTCDGSGADNGDPLLTAGASGQQVDIMSSFNGWGYLHVLNNTTGNVTVPYKNQPDVTAGYLGEIGYYAPVEATDPTLATGSGDLTMHNIEIDPTDRRRAFISWYSAGMRAIEWRPGHLHSNALGEGTVSWNVHEVGRWIAPEGSNFWGVTIAEINGQQYILASDRNTGLKIFSWTCVGPASGNTALYCNQTP